MTALYALTNVWIWLCRPVVSPATVIVAGDVVGWVTARVTPGMAFAIWFVGLVTATPPTVAFASCAVWMFAPDADRPRGETDTAAPVVGSVPVIFDSSNVIAFDAPVLLPETRRWYCDPSYM